MHIKDYFTIKVCHYDLLFVTLHIVNYLKNYTMDWLFSLFTNSESMAHIALLYAVVISLGVYLGKIKIGGISLGVTFVLFAGILAGHIGFTAPLSTLTFMQDFGLILFVFMIGLQVGPGFFSNFKEGGVTLNILAASVIVLNIAIMFACYFMFFDTSKPENLPMMIGVLYGAVTNTPGLGAAQEALGSIMGSNTPTIANGYACAYPLGVLGIIGGTIAIRYICRVKLQNEEDALDALEVNDATKPHLMHLIVENQFLAGHTMLEIHDFMKRDFVCSRILRDGQLIIPKSSTTLEKGDKIYIVCSEQDAEAVQAFIGHEIVVPEFAEQEKTKQMISRRILITKPEINGKTLAKLHFSSVYGALDDGTIDGQENPVEVPAASGFYDVQTYISMSDHMSDAWIVGINSALFKSLTPEQQDAIIRAGEYVQKWNVNMINERDKFALNKLTRNGMKVNQISAEEKKRFAEIAKSCYPSFRKLINDDKLFDAVVANYE